MTSASAGVRYYVKVAIVDLSLPWWRRRTRTMSVETDTVDVARIVWAVTAPPQTQPQGTIAGFIPFVPPVGGGSNAH